MLPLMTLQPNDIATFTSEPDSAELLPRDAVEPVVAFADILQVGLQPPAPSVANDGRPMPFAGKGLPPAVALDVRTGVPAIERTQGLPGGELPAVDVRLAPAALDTGVTSQAGLRLPAPLPAEAAPRGPVLPQPSGIPALPRLPADDMPPQAVRPAIAGPTATVSERADPAAVTRPAAAVAAGIPRPVAETAAAVTGTSSTAEPAEALLGRRQRPPRAGLPPRGASAGAPSAPLPRAEAPQAGVAQESPQAVPNRPAPIAPAPQSALAPLEGVNPPELPPAQGPGTAQSPQTGPVPPSPAQVAGHAGLAAAQAQAAIDVPVRDTAWSGMLAERVVVMANNRLQNAEIRLTPAELGPLRVQVAVEDGAANVTFHAQHAVTREAIEQALPRLRELLAENGLTLNQADVGEHAGPGVRQGNRETTAGGRQGDAVAATADDEQAAEDPAAAGRPRPRPESLVDTFA